MQNNPQGNQWLPPDCESARRLLLRLIDHHINNAYAHWLGDDWVRYHKRCKEAAESALDLIEEQHETC